MTSVKDAFLTISKWLGLFHFARRVTRSGVRILCYHGFEIDNEASFRPKLFISPATFERRLQTLKKGRFSVVTLSDAVDHLAQGGGTAAPVVVTIDDGFYSMHSIGAPLLKAYDFPSTLYLTTYYVKHGVPIFRLGVQYLFWRKPDVEARTLTSLLDWIPMPDQALDGDRLMWHIIDHGEALDSEDDRQALLRKLSELVGMDYAADIEDARILSLLQPREAADLEADGVDLQLHTHRHRLSPDDRAQVTREIDDNRAAMSEFADRDLVHFCYPSGQWNPNHVGWLEAAGVKSATTCDAGLNYPGGDPLTLRRFLDSESMSDIAFESEVWGYSELLRKLRAAITRRPAGST